MTEMRPYLIDGLGKGYLQNLLLKAEHSNDNDELVEYLLTVNVAQNLIKWNELNGWSYAINLEYETKTFFNNAFLPYMFEGNSTFDQTIVHPNVLELVESLKIRDGKLDIGISTESPKHANFKESVCGIELKGINPTNSAISKDVHRLVQAMEMIDEKFQNSIDKSYCLHIKRLGGDKKASSKETLENRKANSLQTLKSHIDSKVEFKSTTYNIFDKVIDLRPSDTFNERYFENDNLTYHDVAKDSKIVYAVLIEIYRLPLQANG